MGDGCWHFTSSLWYDSRPGVPPGTYFLAFNLDVNKPNSSSEGVCGAENGRDLVLLSDVLFSAAELNRLYEMFPDADIPRPPTTKVERRLSEYTPRNSPEEMCRVAESISYEDASAACESLIEKDHFFQS